MNKKEKKTIKILVITLFVVCIMAIVSNHYAAINEKYEVDTLVVESTDALNKKMKDSVLVKALAQLLYALASLGEYIIGVIFQSVAASVNDGGTYNATFPWADAIVFNAVELLDVNFLNPARNSIVVIARQFLTIIYASAFSIAISFFFVATLVMGLKLAFSMIASEKAKYKQAMLDWLIGLLLLFTMHFIMSFSFYLNEELVKIASDIVIKALEDQDMQQKMYLEQFSETLNQDSKDRIMTFLKQMSDVSFWSELTYLGIPDADNQRRLW